MPRYNGYRNVYNGIDVFPTFRSANTMQVVNNTNVKIYIKFDTFGLGPEPIPGICQSGYCDAAVKITANGSLLNSGSAQLAMVSSLPGQSTYVNIVGGSNFSNRMPILIITQDNSNVETLYQIVDFNQIITY